ncbi:MAG TPA: P-loop NTPase [Candidatus Dormibacteraeota bacterium]|nr:P-loop NTPase [Candidatus Dormibacteraeota bacterium]
MTRRRLGRGLYDLGVSPFAAPETRPLELTLVKEASPAARPRPIVVCVTSGKGGTGKSILTSNLAVHLAASGMRVVAVDADMGLANLHLLLGMQPRRTVMDVIEAGATIDDIAEDGPLGVRLAGGGSGRPEMADLHASRLRRLVAALDATGDRADVVLVDTGAGIGRATTSFLYAFEAILVVTSPDLTAMTDGYAVIKNVSRNNRSARIFVVVNRAHSAVEGLEVFSRIERVSQRFLERGLTYLGHVLNDARVSTSVAARIPILLNQPAAPASACLRGVGRALLLEIESRRSAAGESDRGPECA